MGSGNSLTIKSSDNGTTIFVSSTKSRQVNTGNKTNFDVDYEELAEYLEGLLTPTIEEVFEAQDNIEREE